MENKKCFFTGHRILPVRIYDAVYNGTEQACRHLIKQYGVTDFICGGALGFDTLAAQVVINLRKVYPDIRLLLYLPCIDQTRNWRKQDVKLWNDILNSADDYKFITKSTYTEGCMHKRNREMVHDSEYGIVYCTHAGGGAAYTLKYAQALDRKIILINKEAELMGFVK